MLPVAILITCLIAGHASSKPSTTWVSTFADSLGLPVQVYVTTSNSDGKCSQELSIPTMSITSPLIGTCPEGPGGNDRTYNAHVFDSSVTLRGRFTDTTLLATITTRTWSRTLRFVALADRSRQSSLRNVLKNPTPLDVIHRQSGVGISGATYLQPREPANADTAPTIVIVPAFENTNYGGDMAAADMCATLLGYFYGQGYNCSYVHSAVRSPQMGRRARTMQEYSAALSIYLQRLKSALPSTRIVLVGHADGAIVVTDSSVSSHAHGVIALCPPLHSGKQGMLDYIAHYDALLGVDPHQTEMSTQVMSLLADSIDKAIPTGTEKTVVVHTIENLMAAYEGRNDKYGVFARFKKPSAYTFIYESLVPWLVWNVSQPLPQERSFIERLDNQRRRGTSNPLLVLCAEQDISRQVYTKMHDNKNMSASGKGTSVQLFAGTNHYLQPCGPCRVDDALASPTIVDDRVLRSMLEWISALSPGAKRHGR